MERIPSPVFERGPFPRLRSGHALPGRRLLPASIATLAVWSVLAPAGLAAQQPPAAPAPPAPSAARTNPAERPAGLDLYVLVKKLNRINARAETAIRPSQARRLYDLLEPLYERPEMDPRETKGVVADVRRALTPAQAAALGTIRDITPQSVMPPAPAGLPADPEGFGPPGGFPGGPPGAGPGGPPGEPVGGPPGGPGLAPPGGAAGAPAGGLPGRVRGGRRGGGRGGPQVDPSQGPGFNPFYTLTRAAVTEQAGRDLRQLLDTLDAKAPPVSTRPMPIGLATSQRISVDTFHYDLARTGWNAKERVLTPRNVDKDRFGRWWHTPLDGQVYAAPMVVTGISVNGRARDVVIAPTENNSVYALDADTGAVLWKQHLAKPLGDDEYNDCINITPLHGITSTPVIDLDRKEIYVCGVTQAKLKQL